VPFCEQKYFFTNKQKVKNIKWPVYLTTSYLIIYTLIAQYEPWQFIAPWLFIFSPFIVLWMVFSILKYGEPSKYTFDERFYDDMENSEL
jgi:hypothetical protein